MDADDEDISLRLSLSAVSQGWAVTAWNAEIALVCLRAPVWAGQATAVQVASTMYKESSGFCHHHSCPQQAADDENTRPSRGAHQLSRESNGPFTLMADKRNTQLDQQKHYEIKYR